jgi:hypothetical protein
MQDYIWKECTFIKSSTLFGLENEHLIAVFNLCTFLFAFLNAFLQDCKSNQKRYAYPWSVHMELMEMRQYGTCSTGALITIWFFQM